MNLYIVSFVKNKTVPIVLQLEIIQLMKHVGYIAKNVIKNYFDYLNLKIIYFYIIWKIKYQIFYILFLD